MSADINVSFDFRDFSRAINQYVKDTGKNHAESLNRCMRNLAITAVQQQAIKGIKTGEISQLSSRPWWPKLMAKMLAARKTSNAVMQRVIASKAYQGQHATNSRSAWAQEARKLSRAIIGRRKAALTFLKAILVAAANAVPSTSGRKVSGKKFNGITASCSPAVPSRLTSEFKAGYAFKNRDGRQSVPAEARLYQALHAAIPVTVADMVQYGQKKAHAAARRASA